jgi:hypothetical protein
LAGLDPAIHAFLASDNPLCGHVGGRNKSGHGEETLCARLQHLRAAAAESETGQPWGKPRMTIER